MVTSSIQFIRFVSQQNIDTIIIDTQAEEVHSISRHLLSQGGMIKSRKTHRGWWELGFSNGHCRKKFWMTVTPQGVGGEFINHFPQRVMIKGSLPPALSLRWTGPQASDMDLTLLFLLLPPSQVRPLLTWTPCYLPKPTSNDSMIWLIPSMRNWGKAGSIMPF